jgi:hypothetical protein
MSRPGLIHRSYAAAASRPRAHAPVAAAVISNRPTPQFAHHHEVIAPQVDHVHFRQNWKTQTKLDSLLEAGRINREAWDCAQLWRRWAEVVAPFRAQSWDVRVDASAVANDTSMLLRVNAAAKLRATAEALGELRIRLLEACVLRDRSWRELGQLLRVSDKTAMRFVVEALKALADHTAGRVVAPAPVIRFRNQPGSRR